MNRSAFFNITLVAALTFGSALLAKDVPIAPPETLTAADIANHPERLPDQVTLNDTIKFSGGKSLRKGQHFHPISFDGQTIRVDGGNNTAYPLELSDCDFVDAANAAWSKLTPAQRAVDAASLANDASLWPDKVKVLVPVRVGNRGFRAGSEFALAGYNKDGAHIYSPDNDGHLINVQLADTDLLSRARDIAKTDLDQRPSRIAEALRGHLVNADGKPSTADLDSVKVFALYYGAGWCPWCHKLTPPFVKAINDIQPRNPHLLVVMVNDDDKPQDMLAYMTESNMPWPAISKADSLKFPSAVLPAMRREVPELILLDRSGNQIYDQPGGGPDQISADLATLQKLDQSGVAH